MRLHTGAMWTPQESLQWKFNFGTKIPCHCTRGLEHASAFFITDFQSGTLPTELFPHQGLPALWTRQVLRGRFYVPYVNFHSFIQDRLRPVLAVELASLPLPALRSARLARTRWGCRWAGGTWGCPAWCAGSPGRAGGCGRGPGGSSDSATAGAAPPQAGCGTGLRAPLATGFAAWAHTPGLVHSWTSFLLSYFIFTTFLSLRGEICLKKN